MAAAALTAAAGLTLPIVRTTLAELASSVANRVAPGGLGAAATDVRYLQRSGLDRARAVAAVGLTSAVGFVVHGLGLVSVGAAMALTHSISFHPRLPSHWTLLVVAAALLAAAGLLRLTSLGRDHIGPPVRAAVQALRDVVHQRRRAVHVVAAAVGVTGGYILALAAALRAFGAHPSLLTVAAAYLMGAAIGSASPTPGGLGAVEAALVAGLTRLAVPAGPAIAGVLGFRLVTYWLPILPNPYTPPSRLSDACCPAPATTSGHSEERVIVYGPDVPRSRRTARTRAPADKRVIEPASLIPFRSRRPARAA
jgi:uncharacterized membrane protein YbhN (UPF0104 family)